MQIALFFGSFNPFHLGHQKLGEWLVDNDLFDEIWFVVSPSNPLKDKNLLIDEYVRLEMLVGAIKDNPRLKASDVEFLMPIPSYTIHTLRKLSADFPEHDFSLVIGSDNALVFDQWKDYQTILEQYPIVVYPRKGYDIKQVASLYPQMKLVDTEIYDISSTQIRLAISQQKDITEWLHPFVYQFIMDNDLYQ